MATQKVPSPRKSAQRKETAAAARRAQSAPVAVLPDAPMIRTSERRDFKRCQQRWWWAWREGLRKKGDPPNALWFGIGIHLALAHYYGRKGTRRNKDFVDVWRGYVDDEMRFIATTQDGTWDDKEFVDARALGEAMLLGYHAEYGGDRWWDVIYTEETFQIDIPHPDDEIRAAGGIIAVYAGTFDGVYRSKEDGKVYLMEHKTAGSISTAHLALDDQAGGYWAVATQILRSKGVLDANEQIHGITYNYLRKALPDPRPRNDKGHYTNKPTKDNYISQLHAAGVEARPAMTLATLEQLARKHRVVVLGDVSKSQPSPLFVREDIYRTPRERVAQIRKVQDEATQMEDLRSGRRRPTKNPTRDCTWDCQFYNLCEVHERGGDVKEFARAVYRREDPYADHRKSAHE